MGEKTNNWRGDVVVKQVSVLFMAQTENTQNPKNPRHHTQCNFFKWEKVGS